MKLENGELEKKIGATVQDVSVSAVDVEQTNQRLLSKQQMNPQSPVLYTDTSRALRAVTFRF